MLYIAVIITFLLGFVAYKKHKSLFNPNVAFCFLFTFSLYLSSLNYNKVPQPTLDGIFIVLLGVLFFWLGCNISDDKFKRLNTTKSFLVNEKRLKLVLLLGVATTFLEIKRNVTVFLHGGLMEIYAQRLAMEYSGEDNSLSKSFEEAINRQFVFSPVMYFLMPMTLYMFFVKNQKIYLYVSLLVLLSILISDGGRTVVMLYIIYIIFFVQCKKRVIKLTNPFSKIKTSRKYKLLFIVIGVLSSYVFVARATDLIDTIVAYYGYPVILMEKKLDIAMQSGYTYGMMALQGLLRPILNIFKMGTGISFDLLERASDASSIVQQAESLSSEVMYNAFVTPFYYFYVDFGYLGVALESFIFGYFTEKTYLQFKYGQGDRAIVLFALAFAFPICFAQVRFAYALNLMPWAMVLAFFVCSTKNKRL